MNRPAAALAMLVMLVMLVTVAGARADDSDRDRAEHRGGLVFLNYCSTCHGITANGNGRAAKLYNPKPANLVKSDKNDAYKESIIRRGGGAIGRSKFMPPWNDELTNEQIKDVIAFLGSIQERKPKD
jgi:mono/diheme cytochrome c family protein